MSSTVSMVARTPVPQPDRPRAARPVGLRVGGQALPDGVLMRAGRGWAIARADGSVVSGHLPTHRWSDVPIVRVLLGLTRAFSLGMGRRLHRGTTGRLRLLASLVLSEAAVVAAGRVIDGVVPWGSNGAVQILVGFLAGLAAFRLAAPGTLWGYHGAEHKAVAAYEAGADLSEAAAGRANERVHDRCGTNLLAVLAVVSVLVGSLPLALQIPATVLGLAVVVEAVTAASRRPRSPLTRALLAPGRLLQRFVTTVEPDPAQLAVAVRALLAALDRHADAPAAGAATASVALAA